LQSKKGGLAAWEPAGAQEWLEVSIVLIYTHSLDEIHSLVDKLILPLLFIFSYSIPLSFLRTLLLSMNMLSALDQQFKL
jgi:hypothetical protein